jgi:hypothetical protein
MASKQLLTTVPTLYYSRSSMVVVISPRLGTNRGYIFSLLQYANILVWHLIPSYGGKSILRKNVMSSTSSSGKCIGSLDAFLSHQFTINSHYIEQVIHPVWSYGIELWGCVSDSNIQVIQRYQNKVLKCIVNAPRYVRNSDLHRDLGIETVTDIIAKFSKSHEKKLQDHMNIEASRLLNVNNITRRLKRKKPFELVRS